MKEIKMVKDVLAACFGPDWRHEIIETPERTLEIYTSICTRIDFKPAGLGALDPLQIESQIRSSIAETPFIMAMREDHSRTECQLSEEIADLREEVEKLMKYKEVYELNFKMKHGTPILYVTKHEG